MLRLAHRAQAPHQSTAPNGLTCPCRRRPPGDGTAASACWRSMAARAWQGAGDPGRPCGGCERRGPTAAHPNRRALRVLRVEQVLLQRLAPVTAHLTLAPARLQLPCKAASKGVPEAAGLMRRASRQHVAWQDRWLHQRRVRFCVGSGEARLCVSCCRWPAPTLVMQLGQRACSRPSVSAQRAQQRRPRIPTHVPASCAYKAPRSAS